MSKLLEMFKSFVLIPSADRERARDEAYLAQAVDVCDLERRMEEIDRRSQVASPFGGRWT
jgi:Protein of unknown function (DUF3563)